MTWKEPLRSIYSWFSLRWIMTLLCLWVGSAKSGMGAEGQEAQGHARGLGLPSLDLSERRDCWVFLHLQKSGGSSVKTMLKLRWQKKLRVYDTIQWLQGDNSTRQIAKDLIHGEPYKVAAGGYTEGLRSVVRKSCRWLVIFRHPVSRLMSAFSYCQANRHDPLCAYAVLDGHGEVSLEGFARHWGNFGFRQFVLGFVSADAVKDFVETKPEVQQLPGWYHLKMYLDHRGSMSGGDENTVMYEMLHDVRDLIRDDMDAVGILEDFDTTLRLFDRVLDMPGLRWRATFSHLGIHNKAKKIGDELGHSQGRVWMSAEIKRYISLDILLYEHAVDIFHVRTRQLGLDKPSSPVV